MSQKELKIPFFYIIRHSPTGMLYAGSKYGKDSNPDNFMIEGGYLTSSNKVKELIESDGLDSFKIESIVTDFEDDMTAYEYETVFLQTWDIAKNNQWLNKHNNDGYFDMTIFGSAEFKQYMLSNYGVEYGMQSEEFRNKAKNKYFIKNGVEYPFQNEEVKLKCKLTSIRNRGVDHHMKNLEGLSKFRNTCISKFGFDHPMRNCDIVNKSIETNIRVRGVKNSSQDPIVREKMKATCISKYGVENPYQSEIIKSKIKETCISKYGVEYYSQTNISRNNLSIKHSGKTVWNDGIRNYNVLVGNFPEPHWVLGLLPRKKTSLEHNAENSARQLGSKLWNDGIRNYRVKAGDIPESHWILGKIKK